LFRSEIYVRDGGEYIGDRFPGTSLYINDDCVGIWVTSNLAISGGQLLVLERVLADERFAWGMMLHTWMVVQLDHYRSTGAGEFAFGSILVAWFLERVPMLRPRILLSVPGARESQLRQWSTVLLLHGGGEGGHFFSAEAAQVWRQMSQVILWYPYVEGGLPG
jgi:hypothetical protein